MRCAIQGNSVIVYVREASLSEKRTVFLWKYVMPGWAMYPHVFAAPYRQPFLKRFRCIPWRDGNILQSPRGTLTIDAVQFFV
jgi:hypothetical protein